jgi:hypothetical protein
VPNVRYEKPMNRFFYCLVMIILFFLPGCSTNIRNISADCDPAESIIVGRIETVSAFWDFSLYEEGSKTEDQIEIAGTGFGLTRASKLQNQGFLFKIVRPGTYILRLKKVIEGEYAQDNILRFRVPEGRLIYFGTIRIVIDRYSMPHQTPLMFKYHFVGIDEDETLRQFENQYPQAFSAYKDRIIRIPSRPRPTYMTYFPSVGGLTMTERNP